MDYQPPPITQEKPPAPERIWMQLGGSYKAVGHVWKEQQSNPDESCVRYVRKDIADAQAQELRALLNECRTSVEFHADNIGDMVTPNWMERRRREGVLWALFHRIDAALGKPTDTEQEEAK